MVIVAIPTLSETQGRSKEWAWEKKATIKICHRMKKSRYFDTGVNVLVIAAGETEDRTGQGFKGNIVTYP